MFNNGKNTPLADSRIWMDKNTTSAVQTYPVKAKSNSGFRLDFQIKAKSILGEASLPWTIRLRVCGEEQVQNRLLGYQFLLVQLSGRKTTIAPSMFQDKFEVLLEGVADS